MIRTLLFFLLFCADLHVKADLAVASGSSKKNWKGGGLDVVLQPGSLLEQREGELVNLVKGRFLIGFANGVSVRTPYAAVLCQAESCAAIILRDAEGMEIKALKGEFSVRRLGDTAHYNMIAGSRMSVRSVAEDGKAEMEFPQSLPWDSTVKEWAKFFPGDMKAFRPVLTAFRADWKHAVEVLSSLHTERAGREIASHEKALVAEAARQAAEERANARLRELFRQKNDMGAVVPDAGEDESPATE